VEASSLTPLLLKMGCRQGAEKGEFRLSVPLVFPVEVRRRAKRG
jgi:hypothetical protein